MSLSITAKNYGYRHAGRETWAINDLSFCIESGQKILLVGASGAGKSTLLHGLCGLLSRQEGEVSGQLLAQEGTPEKDSYQGVRTSSETVHRWDLTQGLSSSLMGKIGLIQQDPESQVCMQRVGDEVAFGLENQGIAQEEIWPRVRAALQSVRLEVPLDWPTANLSGGQKQRLAIAAALAMRPGLLLLDEPTANLDAAGTLAAVNCIADAQAQTGSTTIVVEHHLEPWIDFADRMIVLTKEGIVADGDPTHVLETQTDILLAAGIWIPGQKTLDKAISTLAEISTSRAQATPKTLDPTPEPTATYTAPCLETIALQPGYRADAPIQTDLNLQFFPGVSTCITGVNGAGKSTLALTLAGLLEPLSGKIQVSPEIAGDLSPTDLHNWKPSRLLGRISMVFQEPGYQFVANTVRTDLAVGLKCRGLSESEINAKVERVLESLSLKDLANANPFTLSGGEKRRLSVASALICAPKILILDEPTFGQDRNTWIALVNLLREVVAQGTTVISMTHDELFIQVMGKKVIHLEAQPHPKTLGQASQSELDAPKSATKTTLQMAPNITPRTTPKITSRATLGATYATNSLTQQPPAPIDLVNPVIQALGLVFMTIPLVCTLDWVSPTVALVLEIFLLPFLRLKPRQILARISILLSIAPITAISLLLYGDPGGQTFWQWGPILISENSVALAISIALRVVAIGMPSVLVLSKLDPLAMADGMTQVLKMPTKLVFSSVAGLRMAALMRDDWFALQRARRSRGISDRNPLKAFLRNAFAMLVFALQRADTLSLTMEARGLGSDQVRTNARESTVSKADAIMLGICILVPVIALGTAVITGHFRWLGL